MSKSDPQPLKNGSIRIFRHIFVYGPIIFGLYLTSLQSYVLFHSLIEIFSIVVGCSIFILAWNSKHHIENDYLLFLGIVFLFIGSLDLIHTLAYKGMGVFTAYNANLPTQLWIASRYLLSCSLLIAPVFLSNKLKPQIVFWGYMAITAIILTAIFSGVFPDCFVEGVGLTQFKIVSEYIIILILFAAVALLLRNRIAFDREVLIWLIISIVLTIGAELAFTTYISVYGFSNMVGHFFKSIAYYFMYMAIVEIGLKKPHRLLFRNLKQSESDLQKALVEVKILAITDHLTGLFNRRHFFEIGELEVQRAHRYSRPLSAIMLDIDDFKSVNDSYGHAVGDQVLQDVAKCFRQVMRKEDVLGRYGGDEFAFLLPESDLIVAGQVAERLRVSISKNAIDTKAGPLLITVSLGVTALGNECATLENLLDGADHSLFTAKRNGRNRVGSS
ncbi:MAG: GGDEF domain-containing protein [Leptolinea sp.]